MRFCTWTPSDHAETSTRTEECHSPTAPGPQGISPGRHELRLPWIDGPVEAAIDGRKLTAAVERERTRRAAKHHRLRRKHHLQKQRFRIELFRGEEIEVHREPVPEAEGKRSSTTQGKIGERRIG